MHQAVEAMFSPGDRVEVRKVWAAQGAFYPPLYAWYKGYRVISCAKNAVQVMDHRGLVFNYAPFNVRRDEAEVKMQ